MSRNGRSTNRSFNRRDLLRGAAVAGGASILSSGCGVGADDRLFSSATVVARKRQTTDDDGLPHEANSIRSKVFPYPYRSFACDAVPDAGR